LLSGFSSSLPQCPNRPDNEADVYGVLEMRLETLYPEEARAKHLFSNFRQHEYLTDELKLFS
jgi:hypothetical protein